MSIKGLTEYEIKNNVVVSLSNDGILTKYKKGKCGKKGLHTRKVCSFKNCISFSAFYPNNIAVCVKHKYNKKCKWENCCDLHVQDHGGQALRHVSLPHAGELSG